MRRRLQNKRASQLRPLNSERKRQGFLWGTWPQRPIAHSFRECGLSIFTAFDMPRFSNPCRDSKYHRYDFEFLEQSPVNNKQINDTSLFMRPRLAITPIRPQYQHGRMAWAKPALESNEEPHIARKEIDVTKKDPVWDASCDKISNQNVYSYHFSQNRVLFSLSRPISTTCVLSPRSTFFSGRMLYGYPTHNIDSNRNASFT